MFPMLIDTAPLRRHRLYRLIFISQFVSAFGTFLTITALPIQVYDLTHSSALVGLLSVIELVTLTVASFWGGAFADALDRRRLLLWCEGLLMICSIALVANSRLSAPNVPFVFAVAALMSLLNGFHRPALVSLAPNLVDPADLPAVSALGQARMAIAAVGGPALAGMSIAVLGTSFTFAVDAMTFGFSLLLLSRLPPMPAFRSGSTPAILGLLDGLRYAGTRADLIATYLVDILASTLAMPVALFPALAAQWGGSSQAGYLYAAMSFGGLVASILSGWTAGIRRQGVAVFVAAALWGLAITGLGYSGSLKEAVVCLALAGAADTISGLFRMTIWNETIPPSLRGRMASIEQLSYVSGPLLGNARAGFMAEKFGLMRAVSWGGLACFVCLIVGIPMFHALWRYRKGKLSSADAA